MDYEEWNALLGEHFFNAAMANRRVRLNVTRELLDRLGQQQGCGSDDFVAAVKESGMGGDISVCNRALIAYESWFDLSLFPRPKYPPYVGYLCLFVLAVAEGDYPPNAYYPRLRQVLGELPSTGLYPNFDKMVKLWQGLQHWANKEQQGRLGLFLANRRGQLPYISLPMAQVLLTNQERASLPRVFNLACIDPDYPPPRTQLAIRVAENGEGVLPRKTLRLLREPCDLREYLLDDIEDELEGYDPASVRSNHTEGTTFQQPEQQRRRRGLDLFLCLKIDRKQAKVTARFRYDEPVSDSDLETGLRFFTATQPHGLDSLTCGGRFPGWSSVLEDGSGKPWDASSLDWGIDQELLPAGPPGLRLILTASDVRVFVPGRIHGLDGYVEQHALPPSGPCVLAASEARQGAVEAWAAKLPQASRAGFIALPVNTGVPSRWRLYSLAHTPTDDANRCGFPGEHEMPQTRVQFRGGIKAPGDNNSYFVFAPPCVVISGDPTGLEVRMDDRSLTPDDDGAFHFPRELAAGTTFTVRAFRSSELVRARRITLVGDFNDQNAGMILAMFGRDGTMLRGEDGAPACAGGWIVTEAPAHTAAASPTVLVVESIRPADVAPMVQHIKAAVERGDDEWHDPAGNRFTIMRQWNALVLVDRKDDRQVSRSVMAIREAGFEARALTGRL